MAGNASSRPMVLFGANGQLGSALARAAAMACLTVSWAEAQSWTPPDIDRWLAGLPCLDGADLIFTNGLTDPSLPEADLRRSNTDFPMAVLAAASRYPNLRFLTIGTVMETRPAVHRRNRYIASKAELFKEMRALAEGPLAGRILHLRLHTLYGVGMPHRHMFLGQMLDALDADKPFAMTNGRQFRQYHHTDDIARAIIAILASSWPESGVLQLNSTETLQLREIAHSVFAYFCKPALLRIGALPEPEGDISEDPAYEPSDRRIFPATRPTLASINTWLMDCSRPSTARPKGLDH